MDTDNDYIKLLELQVECLSRALLNISSDLVQAGMAEYEPRHAEMIEMGGWALGLFDVIGIDKSTVRDWQNEDRPE